MTNKPSNHGILEICNGNLKIKFSLIGTHLQSPKTKTLWIFLEILDNLF